MPGVGVAFSLVSTDILTAVVTSLYRQQSNTCHACLEIVMPRKLSLFCSWAFPAHARKQLQEAPVLLWEAFFLASLSSRTGINDWSETSWSRNWRQWLRQDFELRLNFSKLRKKSRFRDRTVRMRHRQWHGMAWHAAADPGTTRSFFTNKLPNFADFYRRNIWKTATLFTVRLPWATDSKHF